jgi:hypothetical protein
VEAEVDAISKKISAVEAQVQAAEAAGNEALAAQLRTKEAQLRTKEEQLRTEKAQLRTDQAQLRTIELLKLQLEQGDVTARAARGTRAARWTPPCPLTRPSTVCCLAGTSAAPPPPQLDLSLTSVEASLTLVEIKSPSKAGKEQLLRPALAVLSCATPLVLHTDVPPGLFAGFYADAGLASDDELFSEAKFYPLVTRTLPPWVEARTRDPLAKQNAASLYGPVAEIGVPPHVRIPWFCEPEADIRALLGHPAFAAELKGDKTAMNQLVTYILFGMLHAAFRQVPGHSGRRFHTRPPVGHGLLAFPHVGYLVGVEWVGKLFVYPVSQPFFLNSPQHAAAVAALRDDALALADSVWLGDGDSAVWRMHPPDGPARVSWTHTAAEGGRFRKVIECDAFDEHPQGGARRLRALHAAYAAYAATWAASEEAPPAALLPARLLYGVFALCVDMPFVGTRTATDAELRAPFGGAVLDALAAALGWLARRGLLYIDIRTPNVRVADADAGATPPLRAWLVDYDDMLVLESPLRSADALLDALLSDPHGANALAKMPGLAAAVRAQWPGGAAAA